jgi:hypothetical protein
VNLSAANLSKLGVPPGLKLDASNNQQTFFKVPTGGDDSPDDSYYHTLVVSPLTGAVTVYDYAWGNGDMGGGNWQWDRKKDGE